MPLPKRTVRYDSQSAETFIDREWLVTNGMGGYASGTLANVPTRRYHGLLVAALPAPLGRTMMLHHVVEQVRLPDGKTFPLGGFKNALGTPGLERLQYAREFQLEGGLPAWLYEVEDFELIKQVVMLHEQNTVHISYRLLRGSGPIELQLHLVLHPRGHDHAVDQLPPAPWSIRGLEGRYELMPQEESLFPPLRLFLHADSSAMTMASQRFEHIFYQLEERRGYASIGVLWSPGYFGTILAPEHSATLIASTETWESILALSPEEAVSSTRKRMEHLCTLSGAVACSSIMDELILAADQFIITPVGRQEEHARARAAGDEVRTIIAGYHWFTDWGRDTMISLEGLTLVTGRRAEAAYILKTFGHYVRDGLIPNMFPEGQSEGLYHTADATLWYFHALDRYLQYTDDPDLLPLLLPTLVRIYEAHLNGTSFGIGVDPGDGLLGQGAENYQLTWMDAKVDGWVVTPRRGKTVEINALWYNALRLLESWLRQDNQNSLASQVSQLAAQAQHSFNEKFWISPTRGLLDVVDGPDGNDPACRPNQILSFALRHPVLHSDRWEPVLEVVQQKLLTPVGLRSLASGHPDYKAQYFGDLRARDAAYHQGTVWAWLIGPFIDAWLRVHPDKPESARRFLAGFEKHLDEACIGSISEIFDAEGSYHPRGCIAQAWSVAEVLRAYCETSQNLPRTRRMPGSGE